MTSEKQKPPTSTLARVDCNLTFELVAILRAYVNRSPESRAAGIGAAIEELLREHPEIEKWRKRLKVKLLARPAKGKRAKQQE